MSKRLRIYLAAPLFTLAERRFNAEIARELAKTMPAARTILPQVRSARFVTAGKMDFGALVRDCIEQIDQADVVAAILDGSDSDSGTTWECGYAFARGKPIIGVRTDLRASEDEGLNAMLRRTCRELIVFPATRERIGPLAREIARAIRRSVAAKAR